MPHKNILLSLAIFLAALTGCSEKNYDAANSKPSGYYKVGKPYQIAGQWYYPKEQPNYDKTGIASWYGSAFHGKKTANGDVFDKRSLTAAHNTLPMPSIVRVTNLENKRSVTVMINDRGPFKKNRVIDLSERGAEILGFKEQGTAPVRVTFLKEQTNALLKNLPSAPKQAIATAQPAPTMQQHFIKAGSFSMLANALKTKQNLSDLGRTTINKVNLDGNTFHQVMLGPIKNRNQAEQTLRLVIDQGHYDAYITGAMN